METPASDVSTSVDQEAPARTLRGITVRRNPGGRRIAGGRIVFRRGAEVAMPDPGGGNSREAPGNMRGFPESLARCCVNSLSGRPTSPSKLKLARDVTASASIGGLAMSRNRWPPWQIGSRYAKDVIMQQRESG